MKNDGEQQTQAGIRRRIHQETLSVCRHDVTGARPLRLETKRRQEQRRWTADVDPRRRFRFESHGIDHAAWIDVEDFITAATPAKLVAAPCGNRDSRTGARK